MLEGGHNLQFWKKQARLQITRDYEKASAFQMTFFYSLFLIKYFINCQQE